MGLEQLLHALERQATETARADLEAARAEAARIETEAAQRLARRMSTGLEEQAIVLRAGAERAIADARRSQRQRALEAREQILTRIFARARELVACGDPAPTDRLGGEVRQALDYVGDVPAVVQCSPTAVEQLRSLLADRAGLTLEPDPALHDGFRVRAADGSVVVDHSAERQLAALRPRLAIQLLRRLEPPS